MVEFAAQTIFLSGSLYRKDIFIHNASTYE
jgi:hypothetical protein